MPAQWGRNQQIIAQREAQAQAPGFWQGVGNVLGPLIKQAPTQIMNMLTGHPIQDILNRNEDIRQQSREALARGDYSTAAGLNLAGIMPGTGDLAIQSGEAFGSGDIGGGIANAGMAMAPFVRGAGGAEIASRMPSLPPVSPGVRAALTTGLGNTLRKIPGASFPMDMIDAYRKASVPTGPTPLGETGPLVAFDNSQLTPVAQGLGPVRPPLSPSQSSATTQVGITPANIPSVQSGVGTPVRPPLSPFEPTSNIPVRPAGSIPPVPPSSIGTRSPISPPLSTSGGLSIPVPPAEPPVPIAPANVPPLARAQGFPIQAPIRSTSGTVVQAPQSTSAIPSTPANIPPMPGVGSPLRPPVRNMMVDSPRGPVTVLGLADNFEPYKTDMLSRGGKPNPEMFLVKHLDGSRSLMLGSSLTDESGSQLSPTIPQVGRVSPLDRLQQKAQQSGGSGPSSRFHAAEGSASSIVDVHQTTKYGTNIAQHLKAGGMTPEQFEALRGNQEVLNSIAKMAHPKSAKQQNPFNMAQFDNTLQSLRDLYKK